MTLLQFLSISCSHFKQHILSHLYIYIYISIMHIYLYYIRLLLLKKNCIIDTEKGIICIYVQCMFHAFIYIEAFKKNSWYTKFAHFAVKCDNVIMIVDVASQLTRCHDHVHSNKDNEINVNRSKFSSRFGSNFENRVPSIVQLNF